MKFPRLLLAATIIAAAPMTLMAQEPASESAPAEAGAEPTAEEAASEERRWAEDLLARLTPHTGEVKIETAPEVLKIASFDQGSRYADYQKGADE